MEVHDEIVELRGEIFKLYEEQVSLNLKEMFDGFLF